MRRRRIKRGIFFTIIFLIVAVALLIVFISPIAKYLIEKYDTKLLGREVKVGWLYLNPFSGYFHLKNVKIFEAGNDTVFIQADNLSAHFSLKKLIRKDYEIDGIMLVKLVAYVIQNKQRFNFTDLIERFAPKDTLKKGGPPVHFNVLDIKITDGEFHYIESSIPVNYFIKKVNIESHGKRWNVDSMDVKFSLQAGIGSGEVSGQGFFDFDSLHYNMQVKVKHFDLSVLEQYLHDLANYGNLRAFLDADIAGRGSLKDKLDLDAKGLITISDFHFGKREGDDFGSFDKLVLDMNKINPKNFQYYLDSVMIDHPFFKYERYDELNNIEKMFGEGGSRIKEANARSDAGEVNVLIEIAKYVKEIGKNFLQSYYKINRVAIYRGDMAYNDFALREKFRVQASPLYFLADSIDRHYKRVRARLWSKVRPYGNLEVNLSLDPNNLGTFDLTYELINVPVSMFNPYVVSYTSFPLDRGSLDFTGYMNVLDSNIVSYNHVVIVDPRLGKKIKKEDTKWLPAPLIMALVRSPGNAIDMEVPIRGSLKDPKFKIGGIILEVLRNIFVKPPTSPYLIHAKNVEQKVEKSLLLQWQMRQTELTNKQERFIEKIADFVHDNPEAKLTITPMVYTEKEKEHLLFFEAKKKFVRNTDNEPNGELTEDDSLAIDNMSVKDSAFVRYLKRKFSDSMIFTIQERCAMLVSKQTVNAKYQQLLKAREETFKSYFEEPGRVSFAKSQTTIPFNGFSYYRIDYNGDIPEELRKAYEELQEINEKKPRGKYRERRRERARAIAEERRMKREKNLP